MKRHMKRDEIWQKGKRHSSSLLKAFQIRPFFNTTIFHFIGTLTPKQWKDNKSCVFLCLCLFTTQNLQLYTHLTYKQEARGSLYSGWITILQIIQSRSSHSNDHTHQQGFPTLAPSPIWWQYKQSHRSYPGVFLRKEIYPMTLSRA